MTTFRKAVIATASTSLRAKRSKARQARQSRLESSISGLLRTLQVLAMTASRRRVVTIGSAFLCLTLVVSSSNAGQLKDLDTKPLTGTVIDNPKLIKDFSLKTSDGKPFTSKNLKNHWTLLFFGFTRCGYVCPTSMTALKHVYAGLQKNANAPKPQIVFVSIDPERDDPARIHQYVTSFNQDFMGATGNKAALNQLTRQLGILYMKIIHADQKPNNYDIDHSGSILLVDPDGELIAVFSMPHQADRIIKDYNAITSHYV